MTGSRKRLSVALDALDVAFAPHTEGSWTGGGCTYLLASTLFAALRATYRRT